jgi:pimeloyl-ACP methyl ester carboxylesterase
MTQNPLPIRSGEKTAAAEMDRTDVSFKTSDGVTLRGWFFTPKSSTTKTKLPCVILTHGISCVKEMGLGEVASKLAADLPSTCLVFDQRGFGASDTAPHAPRQEIATWLQANDLRDAITYAQTREEVDKDKIALWGYSLGGAVSVYVAAIDRRVKAVVALAPGMDGNEIVRRLAPPHALNAMRALFEVDRLARAEGKAPITVPIISGEPGGQCLLPSPESYAFFVEWEKEGSPWKNELTLRR